MKRPISAVLMGLLIGASLSMTPSAAPAQTPMPAAPLPAHGNGAADVAQAPTVLMANDACNPPCVWLGVEYLLWWIKNGPIDTPMLTTGASTLSTRTTVAGLVGPPVNFPFTQGGLGVPTTSVLYGGSGLDYGNISGIRLNGGAWLNQDKTLGLESSAFLLQQAFNRFSTGSNSGTPFLAIPVQDTA